MEDVSKALLIVAGILMGILTISVATYVFKQGKNFVDTIKKNEENSRVNMFNANFTRFIGSREENNNSTSSVRGYATIHDIDSLANFAWDYNNKQVDNLSLMSINEQNEDPRLIHINMTEGILNKSSNEVTNSHKLIITELQNYNQNAYNIMLDQLYYKPNSTPGQNNVISFQIDIIKKDAEGKIINVEFYPTTQVKNEDKILNQELRGILSNIIDEKDYKKYKKFDFKSEI